jgi:RNA polymerase sigma-70 factor (ECF subfamily)
VGPETRRRHHHAHRGAAVHGAPELNAEIEAIFRREYGRTVAVLTRFLGDISSAEEAVQDAFAIALAKWPADGIPPSPAGWLITTARNKALDGLRKEASRPERHQAAQLLSEATSTEIEEHDVRDDQLRLIFTCCHPALAPDAQVALTLRLIGGLGTEEIARAFLVQPATLAQRLSRAKAKIRNAGIPYRIPDASELPARLGAALAVVYLIFNEGCGRSVSDEVLQGDFCQEAIRLGRLLVALMPGESETLGLLALMLLTDARRDARMADGHLVLLSEQDRALWNESKLEEGRALLRICLARNRPGSYQLQAAINAVHSDAPSAAHTDWGQILELYDQLLAISPSAVVALNRAVAVAEVHGAVRALELVETIDLPKYHLYHAVRADLLRRLGRTADAASAYGLALDHCGNQIERDFLMRQRQALARH